MAGRRRAARKGIPFVLASGGHVEPPPAEFADTPMIEKPYTIDRVSPIIDAALGRRAAEPREKSCVLYLFSQNKSYTA